MLFNRYKNMVLYDGKMIGVTDKIIHKGNCVEIIVDGVCVGRLCYGQIDPLSPNYVFNRKQVYNIHIDKLWVKSGYRHGTHYARDMIYYVLSLYEKLDMVTLTARAELEPNAKEDQKPLSQEQLEKFYSKFTYGVDSKKHLL